MWSIVNQPFDAQVGGLSISAHYLTTLQWHMLWINLSTLVYQWQIPIPGTHRWVSLIKYSFLNYIDLLNIYFLNERKKILYIISCHGACSWFISLKLSQTDKNKRKCPQKSISTSPRCSSEPMRTVQTTAMDHPEEGTTSQHKQNKLTSENSQSFQ